jgi:nucleoside-diphosphate-sugar epimerase
LPQRRAVYARAKILAEAELFALQRERGLPLVIVRPGLVVGRGGPRIHSGLGFYNNETRCFGWNDGRNPLPFVLVEDAAEAIRLALDAPQAAGRSFNIVGDARPSAIEYVAAMASGLERPFEYVPQAPAKLYAVEWAKWAIKRAAGRNSTPPSMADLRSRGLVSTFDTRACKAALGWSPLADTGEFLRRVVKAHVA